MSLPHIASLTRRPAPRRRGPRFLIGGMLLFIVLATFPWLVISWLIVDEAPAPVDVIVVLGGEGRMPNRTIHGLELYRQGIAPLVAFTGGAPAGRPAQASSAYRSLQEALARGLPSSAALLVDGAQSTYDEALQIRDLAAFHRWHSLLIVTDPYHTRRVRNTFRAVIPTVQLLVSAAPFIDPCGDPWRCLIFQWRYGTGEALKMIVYWVWHGVPWWS